MLLLPGGSPAGGDASLERLLAHPEIAAANAAFLAQPVVTLPSDGGGRPVVCVLQGEVAACVVAEGAYSDAIVGSQDATTCLIACVACRLTRRVWCAHIDAPQLGARDLQELQAALSHMRRPRLYCAGSYEHGDGPDIAAGVLQALDALPAAVEVALLVVGAANTPQPHGPPATRQLFFDAGAAWAPRPWLCADRGPELARRLAAQHCWRGGAGRALLPVWWPPAAPAAADDGDGSRGSNVTGGAAAGGGGGGGGSDSGRSSGGGGCSGGGGGGGSDALPPSSSSLRQQQNQQQQHQQPQQHPQQLLLLRAFSPDTLTSWQALGYERLLETTRHDDAALLEALSTSPDHEPAHFVDDMRAFLRFLLRAQEPDSRERRDAGRDAAYAWESAARAWAPQQQQQQQEGQQAGGGAGRLLSLPPMPPRASPR